MAPYSVPSPYDLPPKGVYVNYPSREVDKRWYSKEEMEHFGDMVGLDSVQCSKAIIVEDKNKNEMESKKFLVNCVGLEHLISRDVPRRYKANKRGRKHHSKLVLAEQKRQKENHDESVSMLAYVSSKSSRPFRMRAYTIAEMRTHMV